MSIVKFVFALILLLQTVISLSVPLEAQTASTNEQHLSRLKKWQAELRFLAAELTKRHANLFYVLKREDFEREVRELEKKLAQLSDEEITVEMMRNDEGSRLQPNSFR